MNLDFKELKAIGIDVEGVKSYTKGKEGYLSALRMYCKAYETNMENIDTFFKEKDWENYTIVVHSLKSNSRMIGAVDLGDEFERLEMAGRSLNVDTISKYNSETILHYTRLVEYLRKRVKAMKEAPVGRLFEEQAEQIIVALLEALDEFDDEQAGELVKKLAGYPFSEDKRPLLDKAAAFIEDFMYDEASELIQQLRECF